MAVCGRAALVSAGLGRLCRLLPKAASAAAAGGWAWGPASECTWVAFCCPVTKPTRPAPRPRGHPHGAVSLHPVLFPARAQACCPGPRESLCLPGACPYLPVTQEQTASPGCLPGGTLPGGAGAGVLTWAWPEALFGHLVAPGGLAGGMASGVGTGWGWSRCGAQNLRVWAFLSRGVQGPAWTHLSPGCAGAHTHTCTHAHTRAHTHTHSSPPW